MYLFETARFAHIRTTLILNTVVNIFILFIYLFFFLLLNSVLHSSSIESKLHRDNHITELILKI